MAKPSVAVQQALYTRMVAALSATVLDYVPSKQSPPYVVIGESQEFPDDTKTSHGVEHQIEIHVYTGTEENRGAKQAKEILDDIYADLHRRDFVVPGFDTTYPQFDSQIMFPEPAGYRGVIRFRFSTSPS